MFDDPDDAAWCWETMFKNTISAHVKTRKVKIRSSSEPWMSGTIRKALNNRFKLLKKAKSSEKDSTAWSNHKKMRNKCTNLVRESKATFWKKEFQKTSTSKSFWKTVKKFQGKTKSAKIGPLADNNEIVLDDTKKANLMNEFFSTVGEKLATKLTPNAEPFSQIYRVTPSMSEINIDHTKFAKSFQSSVKLGKSSGPDNISPMELKLCEETSAKSLVKVLQKGVSRLNFPSQWKKANVSCIYKKGAKKDCSNYRPIFLLSILSKVFEHYICSIMCDHIKSHDLLSKHQWGFRKHHSTEDLLLHQTECWHKALDKGKTIAVLFVDYQKAFDSVSHKTAL